VHFVADGHMAIWSILQAEAHSNNTRAQK